LELIKRALLTDVHVPGDDEVNFNGGLFNSLPKICSPLLMYVVPVFIPDRVWSIVDDQYIRV